MKGTLRKGLACWAAAAAAFLNLAWTSTALAHDDSDDWALRAAIEHAERSAQSPVVGVVVGERRGGPCHVQECGSRCGPACQAIPQNPLHLRLLVWSIVVPLEWDGYYVRAARGHEQRGQRSGDASSTNRRESKKRNLQYLVRPDAKRMQDGKAT